MVSNNIKTLTFGLLSALAVPADAYWRMSCGGTLVEGRVDSIVTPGKVSGHTHVILGGNGFAPTMDYASTQKSTCTSCAIQGDFSNYWIPKLYYIDENKNFQDVPVNGGTVYYQQRVTSPHSKMVAFPPGFRMTAGSPERRDYTGLKNEKAISHVCLGGGIPEAAPLPNVKCPGGIRSQIYFPSCWDGKNLDSDDHQSHMSYPMGNNFNSGVCPDTHPIPFISIFFEFIFSTADFKWPDPNQQPFVYSMGDTTGYGLHGDFFNGWDPKILQNGIEKFTTIDFGAVGNMEFQGIFSKPAVSGNECKMAPLVDEQINGNLASLPGCNKVDRFNGADKPCVKGAPALGVVTADIYTDVTSKGWEYLGCGVDQYGNNALPTKVADNDMMTVESCVDACGKAGFSISGLEYARQCFCGNTLPPRASPTPGVIGNCDMPCTGNPKQKCGAGSRLSLYQKCSAGACKNADFGLVGQMSGGTAPAAPATPTTGAPMGGSSPAASSAAAASSPSGGSSAGGSTPGGSSTGGSMGGSSGGYGMGGMGGSSSSSAAAAAPSTTGMIHPSNPIATAPAEPSAPTPPSAPISPAAPGSPAAPPPSNETSGSGSDSEVKLPTGWKSAGCYSDNLNPRSLDGITFAWWGEAMTSSGCAKYCDAKGFKYAGTENAGQCFCGNELKKAQTMPSSMCDKACNGAPGEKCGGAGHLSVFTKATMGRRSRIHRRVGHHGVVVS